MSNPLHKYAPGYYEQAELCLEMPWRPSYEPSKFRGSHGRSVDRSLGRSIARIEKLIPKVVW